MTAKLSDVLFGRFGGAWDSEDIRLAVRAVLSCGQSKPGWHYEVGTRGSKHFSGGWAATREGAEQSADQSHRSKLVANPVLGDVPISITKESTGQLLSRLTESVRGELESQLTG